MGVLLVGFAGVDSGLLGRVFGPPRVQLAEAYEKRAGGPGFDHGEFDELLRRYVDADGWVDYDGLKRDEARLDRYLGSLAVAPFEAMGRDQKLALLINAYNAFTLKLILDHYPVKSIKDIPSDDRWDAVRWRIGGRVWSLNQIEHEQIRPNFVEPRIHFVLVCAAVGCPPLRDGAYRAEQLEEQLEEQTRYVHRHGTWFEFEPGSGVLRLTSLYDWYGGILSMLPGRWWATRLATMSGSRGL